MTSGVETLYRDVILDHNKRPRNFRALEGGCRAEGSNPLCGDRLTVYLRIEDAVIEVVTFQGYGCAIAMASASLMTENVSGKTVAEAAALFQRFQQLLTTPSAAPVEDLGALSALVGVRQFPVRVQCAMLPWQALGTATAAWPGESIPGRLLKKAPT